MPGSPCGRRGGDGEDGLVDARAAVCQLAELFAVAVTVHLRGDDDGRVAGDADDMPLVDEFHQLAAVE